MAGRRTFSRWSLTGSRSHFLVLHAPRTLLHHHRPGYRAYCTADSVRWHASSASRASYAAAGSADCGASTDANPVAHNSPVADTGTGAASTDEPAGTDVASLTIAGSGDGYAVPNTRSADCFTASTHTITSAGRIIDRCTDLPA